LPYGRLPGVAPNLIPAGNAGTPVDNLITGTKGYVYSMGDPSADEAYWRGNTSQDLAGNGRAWAGALPSLAIRIVNGDVISQKSGVPNVPAAALEGFANYISLAQRLAFDAEEVPYINVKHPGVHDAMYFQPFYRDDLAFLYANLRHADGGGAPPPAPDRFDYRSISTSFSVWGWTFAVDRQAVEFLNVRGASCGGVTLQGSGRVTVTVPDSCHTGLKGSSTFVIDLGPSMPTDEHSPAGTTSVYGKVFTVQLTPRG
jgi:hypothetical protein